MLLQDIQNLLADLAYGSDARQERQLPALLQESKTHSGRQLLLDLGLIAYLPAALQSATQSYTGDAFQSQQRNVLVMMLQLTRNCCAAGNTACAPLLQGGTLDHVLLLTDRSSQNHSSESMLYLYKFLPRVQEPSCDQQLINKCPYV